MKWIEICNCIHINSSQAPCYHHQVIREELPVFARAAFSSYCVLINHLLHFKDCITFIFLCLDFCFWQHFSVPSLYLYFYVRPCLFFFLSSFLKICVFGFCILKYAFYYFLKFFLGLLFIYCFFLCLVFYHFYLGKRWVCLSFPCIQEANSSVFNL